MKSPVYQREATTRESRKASPSLCCWRCRRPRPPASAGHHIPNQNCPKINRCENTESVVTPWQPAQGQAVPVDPQATDTAYRLNIHIILGEEAVVTSRERNGPPLTFAFQSANLEAPKSSFADRCTKERRQRESRLMRRLASLCSGVVAASGFSRTSYPKPELPEDESV